MENPWMELPEVPPYVLPVDKEAVAGAKLFLDQFPVPYIGARDAPVVMLTLNPGGKSDPSGHTEDYRDQCRKRLVFDTRVPFMPLDPAFRRMAGAQYWRARLARLIERVGEERVGRRLLCIQYFPYQSTTFRSLPTILPSQRFGFELCRSAIREGRLVVILRSRTLWTNAVRELEKAPAIELNNPRSPYVTPNNMPPGDFERIVGAFERG